MPDLVDELRRRLAAAGDPDRAPAMQAYMKSRLPFLGVRSPQVAAICREVIPAHVLPDRPAWERAVRELWDEAQHREERYAALAVARHRLYRAHQDPETLALYRYLVETGAWWDLVDSIASHHVGDIVRAYPALTAPVLREWAVDEDMWVRRTAILCQLGSKAATDTALLDHALRHNLEGSRFGHEFFVRKAVGWALREHAKTDPGWVRAFLARHDQELSGLSRREAGKHL
jgi:3-methyladenine DNA glycosylase AlkD